MFTPRAHLALLLYLCTLGIGCAGNGPPLSDTATGTPTPIGNTSPAFDVIQRNIFDIHCLNAGCHRGTDRAGNLVLEAGASYADLVNVAPSNGTAQAAGLLRVVPGDPGRSFLLTKITNPGQGEGSAMPQAAPLLSDLNVSLVRNWILAGAPQSGVPTVRSTSTALPTPTASATFTGTPTSTWTPITTSTPTITSTPTSTWTATMTPMGTRPPTPTPTLSPKPTATQVPTATPTVTATMSPSPLPTVPPTPTFSVASTFPQIQSTIFNASCLGLSCHNANDQAGNLVLEGSVAYANLVGPPPPTPINIVANQDGMLRVDPGNPANSFLLTKLALPTAFDPQFGSRMPLGSLPLTVEQIDSIRAWILRGALADEAPPTGN